jgi:hypothetical protein
LALPHELGLDCLNRKNSEFDVYPHDPARIMYIHRYALHLDRIDDPLIFFVSEKGDLMATDSIRQMVQSACLRGFTFSDPPKRFAERAQGS